MPRSMTDVDDVGDSMSNMMEYICINTEDDFFNNIIGCLEDMLLDDEFLKLQDTFLDKYWKKFDDSEENKLEYINIFAEYQRIIEEFIEQYLRKRMPEFDMARFVHELINRKAKLDGEIFEMLFAFTNFISFKEMFLDYKAMKEGRTADFSTGISITPVSTIDQYSSKLKADNM